jgi:hypothetical protein
MADLSVEYAPTLGRYREARVTSDRASVGSASTDDLRNAVLAYRALFEELAAQPEGDNQPGGRHAAPSAPGVTAADAADGAAAGTAPAATAGLGGQTAPGSAVTDDAVWPQRSSRG